jgi:hypothetical protein
MKVNERDWMMGEHKIGTQLFYTDVEPELVATVPGTRVLPAVFFYEKSVRCELLKRWEPGEYRLMPNGGFEVWVEDGGRRYFELDQVIVHPLVIKHQKSLDKMKRKAEKEQAKRDRQYNKAKREAQKSNGTGKRGRRPLDPAEKARREQEKSARAIKSGGKRGRPKSEVVSTPKTPKSPTGGKRGRRPLDQSTREARAREAAARSARSGGKRGRPKRG